jgi:hypothetical protein
LLLALLLVCSCAKPHQSLTQSRPDQRPPVGLTLSIVNGKLERPLELAGSQDFVFDRITIAAENHDAQDSAQALAWLQHKSSFRTLNWAGAHEVRAYRRDYKDSPLAVDVFSHVFDAPWISEPNSLELSVLDAGGKVMGTPLRLSNSDFLNQAKQWDFDMIKAEFRLEDFARPADPASAKVKRTVAKIVFALQTNLSKRLRVPPGAQSLKIVWDKSPAEPYLAPIQFLPSPLGYGLHVKVQIDPQKDVYAPGDTFHAVFSLLDDNGTALNVGDFEKNGLTQLIVHLDGPRHDPLYNHEEWLNDFAGKRFAYHAKVGSADLKEPPMDELRTSLSVDLHVPADVPSADYGTYNLTARAARSYGGQAADLYFVQPIQIGRKEPTHFEAFGCKNCHAPGTAMDVGRLIPPMTGTQPLRVDTLDECVACHDNSRGGSRRITKFIHLLHMQRENFPVAKNNCAVCHLTTESIRKITVQACSNCHEDLHHNNQPKYADSQCQGCHVDDARGHVLAKPTPR